MKHFYLTVVTALRKLIGVKSIRNRSMRQFISVRDGFGLSNGGDEELEDFLVPEGVSFFLMRQSED